MQQQKAGEIPFAPATSSVLLIPNGNRPLPPRGQTVLYLDTMLLTLISEIFWVSSMRTKQKLELAFIVSLEFDEYGVASFILEFLRFLQKIAFLLKGSNIILLLT
jgi:hypothetical protein